jgi:hypothetical protein
VTSERGWGHCHGQVAPLHALSGSQRLPLSCTGRTEMASPEATQLFTKWSRGLGFLSEQQAQLQKDRECA